MEAAAPHPRIGGPRSSRRGVDLIIAGAPDPAAPPDVEERALERLARGGHLLCPDRPAAPPPSPPGFAPVDHAGRIFRKLSPCGVVDPPSCGGAPAATLADHDDRAGLIADHVNLARVLAHRFIGRGERTDDLEQVAYLALVRTASRFDPRMGRPFSAFVTPCIVGELKRHFRDKLWMVRVPRSAQEMYLAVRDAVEELGQQNGESPTISRIAAYLDATDEDVLAAMEASTNSRATSLDRPVDDEQGAGTEIPVSEEGFDRSLDRALLIKSIERLSPTDRFILNGVFFEDKTQRELADELSISQMQISRLMNKVLASMRQIFDAA